MSESTIYWITRLDHVHGALQIVAGVLSVAVGVFATLSIMVASVDNRPEARWFYTRASVATVAAVLVVCGAAFIPTTKEACAIIALPAIANDADVQEIGADVVGLAKEWLSELKPEASDE